MKKLIIILFCCYSFNVYAEGWSCIVESIHTPTRNVISSNFMMTFTKINDNSYKQTIRVNAENDKYEERETIYDVVFEDDKNLIINSLRFYSGAPETPGGYKVYFLNKEKAKITYRSLSNQKHSSKDEVDYLMNYEQHGKCISLD